MITNTPWGAWEVLLESPECKVKRITVEPGQRLSYQYHHHRREHWVIVSGVAMVTLDGNEQMYTTGEVVSIGFKIPHRVANQGPERLVFIEVQQGTYFGEDDIVRLQDDYGRA